MSGTDCTDLSHCECVDGLYERIHHLHECIREIAPLVISANFSKERYPLMYAECKALTSKE